MNKNRVLLAGVAAAVTWTVIDFGIHGGLLGKNYEALAASGVLNAPAGWFLPVLLVANLFIGFTLAFLYAAVRSTLGAGPGTALKIGFCVLILYVPVLVTQVAFYKLGSTVNMWSVVGALAQTFGASLVAGWLYKE